MLANEETQNEESQDFGQTMTADQLPHPLNSPLTKERVHLGICLSITKPRGEIILVDALCACLCPPRIIERLGKVDTAELGYHIKEYRENHKQNCNTKQHLVFHLNEQRKQHSADGIEQQYVAVPNEQQMHETDESKD